MSSLSEIQYDLKEPFNMYSLVIFGIILTELYFAVYINIYELQILLKLRFGEETQL